MRAMDRINERLRMAQIREAVVHEHNPEDIRYEFTNSTLIHALATRKLMLVSLLHMYACIHVHKHTLSHM